MPLPLSKPEREDKERNELDGSASKFHKHFINDNNMINTTTYFMESKETFLETYISILWSTLYTYVMVQDVVIVFLLSRLITQHNSNHNNS